MDAWNGEYRNSFLSRSGIPAFICLSHCTDTSTLNRVCWNAQRTGVSHLKSDALNPQSIVQIHLHNRWGMSSIGSRDEAETGGRRRMDEKRRSGTGPAV